MSKEKKFGTFIHGIAASEHLDSSGERIIVEGVDISSLTKDGVFNFEHQSKEASHIVGKILEAKKIFKKSDCENDHHKYFWDKVQMPFVYVAGELFDHVGHGAAQDVAAMLKYDKNLNKDETKALVNFSIEGSRLAKDGSNITKCIARKVSITITPCNKMAHAEHMEKPSASKKDDSIDISKEILSKFKKSEETAIEIIAKGDVLDFKPKKKVDTSDKKTFMPIKVGNQESAPAKTSFTPKRTFSPEKAPKGDMRVGDRIQYEQKPRHKPKTGRSIYSNPDTWKSEDKKKKKKKLGKYDSNVRKAITASCGAGSPSSKTQGAALEKKDILKHLAGETWKDYDKKDELVNFIAQKYPDMNKSEVVAVAKTYAYIDLKKKEIALEKAHIDEGKTAKEKKQARKLRNKNYKSHKKTAKKRKVMRDEEGNVITPYDYKEQEKKAKKQAELKQKLQAKQGKSKTPSKKDLEYPMAASEDEKNVEEMNIDLMKEKPFHGYSKKKSLKKAALKRWDC